MTASELRAFPPVDDTIDFIKQVDWQDVRTRARNGLRNLLLTACVISEKSFDFHCWLIQKLDNEKSELTDPDEYNANFTDTQDLAEQLANLTIWTSPRPEAPDSF